MRRLSLLLLAALLPSSSLAQSIYLTQPEDPLAVTASGLKGDGTSDDTAAIQAAIDKVADTTGSGIVFLPAGRYRITQTIHLWSGVRLIGVGATRPVLVLAPNTPYYQSGHGFLGTGRYMLQFNANKPQPNQEALDANEFTFYSGLSNVDFEVGAGNPAAICVRFHVAQHSFISDVKFDVGEGRAALEDVGNQAENLVMEGGDYGIISVRTSPAWQFLLMDSRFHGQRTAAIHTQEVGMTLIRDEISDTPVAVETPANMPEQLYGRDLLLRNIRKTAFILGDTNSQHNQVTLDNIQADHVAQWLTDPVGGLHLAAAVAAPSTWFVEERLTAGQAINPDGREGSITLQHHTRKLTSAPTMPKSDIPTLPAVAEWTNVRTLGVTGDGGTDDTAAIQHAIDTHRVLYFPTGVYRLRATLHTKPDSVLIGLNPTTAVFDVEDNDENFTGTGEAVPLLESSKGGHEILTGIGIYAGDIAPRAAGLSWRSGPGSFVQDVNFPAGMRIRTLIAPKSKRAFTPPPPRPAGAPAGRPPAGFGPPRTPRVDTRSSEYPSLWVRDGGGGIFRDIWTADTTARAGVLVENTQTPSIAYQISCEHHMHNEVQFHDAANWTVYDLQTEEEMPNGAESTPVELINATNITFVDLFNYRVSRNVMPKISATVAKNSSNIRFANTHVFSMTRLAFDNALMDETSGVSIRTHDFTTFTLDAKTRKGSALPTPAVFAAQPLKKVADGYHDIAGLVSDSKGNIYFADATMSTVASLDTSGAAKVLSKKVPQPMSLAFAGGSDLVAVDRDKAVYSVSMSDGTTTKLTATTPKPNTELILPVGFHDSMPSVQRIVSREGFVYAGRSNMAVSSATTDEPRDFFYAPDTSAAVIAGGSWKGLQQAVQLKPIAIGASTLAVSEEDDKTYNVTLQSLTALTAKPFVMHGGTSVVQDAAGNVYIAGAQVFVYTSSGKALGILEVPERPTSLAIGGADGKTLYIGARSSIYAIGLKTTAKQ